MKRKGVEISFLYETFDGKFGSKTITINFNDKMQKRKRVRTSEFNKFLKEQLNLKMVSVAIIKNIY